MLPHNLAVYLDEVDDDPVAACATAARFGFRQVALRRLWATPIAAASDPACQKIAVALRKHDLQVSVVATTCGRCAVADLPGQLASFQRALLIAAYFRAKFIRVFAAIVPGGGQPADASAATTAVQDWLTMAVSAAQVMSITPVLEIDPDAVHFSVGDVKALVEAQPGLQLLYDPALLIVQRVQDPLLYWWTLRSRIALVDLHDYQFGQSFRPLGHGNCGWQQLRPELAAPNDLLLLLEPGLGRLYGQATTRAQTFALAVEALTAFWSGR